MRLIFCNSGKKKGLVPVLPREEPKYFFLLQLIMPMYKKHLSNEPRKVQNKFIVNGGWKKVKCV